MRNTEDRRQKTECDGGFTLIELLIAVAFAALAAVSLMAVIREDIRLARTSSSLAAAAQAASAPEPALKDMELEMREVSTEEIELGPIRMQRVVKEIRRRDEADGVRMTVYK